MKISSYVLLACMVLILLSFGAMWVVTNIFAIIKVVWPLSILAGMVVGGILGHKITKAHYRPAQ